MDPLAPAPPPLTFETPALPAAATCGFCARPLADRYYTVNGQVACASCRTEVARHVQRPRGVAGVAAAVGLGSAAGLVGAAVWWAIRHFASLEVGLIAIGIGHFVGLGVRRGSGGRGGRGYQVLAVALTYGWITANYVPDIVRLLATSGPAVGEAGAPVDAGAAPPTAAGVIVAFVYLFGIAMAAPFLQGVGNILGILIISFGLWQAWKLNAPVRVDIAGPFALGPSRHEVPPGA